MKNKLCEPNEGSTGNRLPMLPSLGICPGMKIMVTGAQSPVGLQVTNILRYKYVIDPVTHSECDLCIEKNVLNRFEMFEPDYVIHLDECNDKSRPDKMFRSNLEMAMNVLHVCSLFRVRKTVSVIPEHEPLNFYTASKRILQDYSHCLNQDESIVGRYLCAVYSGTLNDLQNVKCRGASSSIFFESVAQSIVHVMENEDVDCYISPY